MHTVGEINVKVSGLSEHYRIALGLSSGGVRSQVARADVGLDFGDFIFFCFASYFSAQKTAEELFGHGKGFSAEEVFFQDPVFHKLYDIINRMRTAILGKGVFGQAMGEYLSRIGHSVAFDTTRDSDMVFVCTASNVVLPSLLGLQNEIKDQKIVICSKGFASPGKLISEALAEEFKKLNKIFFLYGPALAEEITRELPFGMVLAGGEGKEEIKRAMESENLYIELSNDVIGAEICATLKNVMTMLVGVAEGVGLGENAIALVFAKAVEEMKNIGLALGARPETFLSLACIGDMHLSASRNRTLGIEIGKGRKLDEATKEMNYVPGGVHALKDAKVLIEEKNLPAPLANLLYRVVFENFPAKNILKEIMKL